MGNQVSDTATPVPPSAMVDMKTPSSLNTSSPASITSPERSRSSSGTEKNESGSFASTLSKSFNDASSLLKDLKDLPTNVTKELKEMKELKELEEEQEQDETMNSGLISGWLNKQTVLRGVKAKQSSSNNSAWKRRFFVLKKHCLYYYVDTLEASFKSSDPMRILEDNRIPKKLTTSHFGYTFQLEFDKKRFNLAAFSEGDLDAWIDFFNNTDPNKKKEGWLFVKMTYKGWYASEKWEMRYFNMKSDSLEYNHRKQHGFTPLAGCTIEEISDETSFTITSENFSLNLKADSSELRTLWVEAISKEIKRLSDMNETLTDPIEIEIIEKIHSFLERERKLIKKIINKEKPKKFYILSIDGGGLRGVITTGILERIVQEFPDFLDKVDMVTGCSNGGMVAMALAFDHDPKFCRHILEAISNLIFKTGGVLSHKMNSAKFANTSLKLVCTKIWGEKKLRDANKKVVIPGFLMDNHNSDEKLRSCEPRLFHNLVENDPSCDESVADVVMRTGAAPTFFPSYQQYVDGGIFAHDPASCALSLAMSPAKLGIPPQDIVMLSLGTGHVNHYYDDPTHNWGYVQWVPRLMNCLWDGMLKKSELLCRELLGDRYHRMDPLLEKEIPMDDPLQIPKLTEIAKQQDLTETLEWIRKNFYADE